VIVRAPVAVVYQALEPPSFGDLRKPMKPGGYSDSGADIAAALCRAGVAVVTPRDEPDPADALQWVFPDTDAGITTALARGACVVWANTVLFAAHPLARLRNGVRIVGPPPADAERLDDKWSTNELLRAHGLAVTHSATVGRRPDAMLDPDRLGAERLRAAGLAFPLVVKPVRGRGSDGVRKLDGPRELGAALAELLPRDGVAPYGDRLILEEFLAGEEVTITVMPPGEYELGGRAVTRSRAWALPPVARFNHVDGVAPYNGTVAVVRNSRAISPRERAAPALRRAVERCEAAGALVGARAPIRIDCRAGADGEYRLFDLNVKPNLTGPGRPGRGDADSLISIAARGIGWTYTDLLLNVLAQAWRP
jgi:D-alanine-D-alanine ligase